MAISHDLIKICSMEFVATFFYVFMGVGAWLVCLGPTPGTAVLATRTAIIGISMTFGGITYVLYKIMNTSKAWHHKIHFNPAVTIACVVAHEMPGKLAAACIASQIAGGYAAGLLLMPTMGLNSHNMGGYNFLFDRRDAVGYQHIVARGIALEMFCNFLLCLAILTSCTPKKAANRPAIAGFVVLISHLLMLTITSCGLNPARTLGIAWTCHKDNFTAKRDVWVYILGSVLGAPMAGALHGSGWMKLSNWGDAPTTD